MKNFVRKLIISTPVLFFLAYIFTFQTANSHSAMPDAGSVNDPINTSTCARSGCHDSHSPFNIPRANVTIGTTTGNQVPLSGFQYTGSTQYIINLTALGGSTRPGFEMAALTATNAQAGTFAVTNSTNTTLQTQSGRSYIGHKNAGTNSTWQFNWTSPATTAGNITFYIAVNRTNNSNTDAGDSIFLQQTVITPAPVAITVNAGNDVSICPGASTQLQATASVSSGTTYAWSPSAGLSCTNCANPVATPTGTTTYTVTATNGAQTATDAVTVATRTTAAPLIQAIPNALCPVGGAITLGGSSGFSSYAWSTGSTLNPTTVSTTGTYSLTVTDANGCTTSASKTINQGQLPTPVITSSRSFLCSNDFASLSAGNWQSYQWSTGQGLGTINVAQGGIYSVTVYNNDGCSASATYNLPAYPPTSANVNASGPLTLCSGDTVRLTAGLGPAFTFKWNTGATTNAITVSQSGTYTVTVYNPCDSTVSTPQTVVVNPSPVAQVSPAGALLVCNGQPGVLHASPTGLSYVWLRNGQPVNGQTRDSLNVVSAGNYQVIVTQGSCSDTSSNVAVSTQSAGQATVNITASQNYLCSGDVITLTADSGFTTYAWQPISSTGRIAVISSQGTYIVDVTLSNGQCSTTGADTITIANGPAVISPTLSFDTVCAGDTVTITVLPNTYTTYNWSNGATTASISTVNAAYMVTVSQTGYCGTASASILAVGAPIPDAAFTNSNGSLSALTTGGGATYQWFYEGNLIANANAGTYTATQSGNYTLKVTIGLCSHTTTQLVTISGIQTSSAHVTITLYPNPVHGIANFNVQLNTATELKLQITGIDGRTALPQKTIQLPAGENNFTEDLSTLPQGIYIVYLQHSTGVKMFRVLKGE